MKRTGGGGGCGYVIDFDIGNYFSSRSCLEIDSTVDILCDLFASCYISI